MATPPTSPYAVAATGLKDIIETEFAAEAWTAQHDHLHESLGRERVEIGISPVRDVARGPQMDTYIKVQVYLLWEKEISPDTVVNPIPITEYAARLWTALGRKQVTQPGTRATWYYKLESVEYPHDPTGNKTRFEMLVKAVGENTELTTQLD